MRDLTSGMQTAIAQSVIRPVFLVSLEFGASTTLYLNDRARNISWNGQTWLGNGWLRPIKAVQEVGEVRAVGCEINVTGAVSELLAYSLNDARLSNRGKVWLGLLDENETLIADPYQLFSGRLDVPTIQATESEISLTLAYENELRGLDRQNEFRFTDQSQKAIYPDDKGFEYVTTVEKWDGYWGVSERPKWVKFKRTR